MGADGAEWSGYANRLRAGVWWTQTRNPTWDNPAYPVVIEAYGQTNYGTYNFDLTMSYWGQWGDGSVTKRASGSNPLLLAGPGQANFVAQWEQEQTFGFGCTVSGPSAGPVTYTRYGTVPRRPTWNPTAPSAVGVFAEAAGSLRITWAEPGDWRGPTAGRRYYVMVGTNPSFSGGSFTGHNITSGSTVSGLHPGTLYYVAVRGEGVWWDATRNGDWSAVASKTTLAAPTLQGTPAATNVSRDSFVIPTATIANNGGQAPNRYRFQVNTSASETGATLAEQNSWAALTCLGRAANTTYWYRVSAGNAAGWGPWTDWVSVTTLSDAPSTPAAPTVSAITETSATITWVAPAANGATISGYTVVISDQNDPAVPLQSFTVGQTVTSQAVTGLSKAKDYQAFVRANGIPNGSGFSPAAQFRTAGVLATLFPEINDAGVWRPFEIWVKESGTWRRVSMELNVNDTWKWSA